VAEALKRLLDDVAVVRLWHTADESFPLGIGAWSGLVSSAKRYDFAVVILTPDDSLVTRSQEVMAARDNTILELGLFVGALGQDRTFVMASRELRLPTDLAGVTVAAFDMPARGGDVDALIHPASERIREAIRERTEQHRLVARFSLIGSTTDAIEKDRQKAKGIRRFYRCLLNEIERTPLGINSCGPQPFFDVAAVYYGEKLTKCSRDQMEQTRKRIRWYWYEGGTRGINFAPAFFESYAAPSQTERRLAEITDAHAIVAVDGKSGSRSFSEQILSFHVRKEHGINLHNTPFVMLSWFGGSTKDLMHDNRRLIEPLTDGYSDLEPFAEVPNWWMAGVPEQLAARLIRHLHKQIFAL
jgi:hypothetical protein